MMHFGPHVTNQFMRMTTGSVIHARNARTRCDIVSRQMGHLETLSEDTRSHFALHTGVPGSHQQTK